QGTPLYAPYPLSVALPAMMIGHLTFAGFAEAAISAGLVAYLQVADPALLRGSETTAATPGATVAPRTVGGSLRRLWIAVALLMLLTPLGILAAGKAWGEWSPSELARAGSPPQVVMAANSSSSASAIPAGLQRLSNLWTAPFPSYAPGFVRSTGFGYLLSAMFGVGLLLAISLVVQGYVGRRQ